MIDLAEVTQIDDEVIVNGEVSNPNVDVSTINERVNINTIINDNAAILRDSIHQASDRFDSESQGKQRTATVAIACVAFHLLDVENLCSSDIDYILIVGDKYYRDCINSRINPDMRERNRDYLAARELLPQVRFNNRQINITVVEEASFQGHIDRDNSTEGFPDLINALINFFENHTSGILTINSSTVAIHCDRQRIPNTYWLLDSHSRGPKGFKAPSRGVACCMRFRNIHDLRATLRRNLYYSTGTDLTLNIYSLIPLDITSDDGPSVAQENRLSPRVMEHAITSVGRHRIDKNNQEIHCRIDSVVTEPMHTFATSMLRSVAEGVPDMDSVICVRDNDPVAEGDQVRLVDIRRKTAPPLNLERERRMEELSWYVLFPDGKNAFGEPRDIPITPLDYFQARIMSTDKRFQRTDYLFFALSVVEYYRAKSSVSVSCRMRQGESTPHCLVDNMHLTMRNIRGSAAYWKLCCSELIAMVRALGPPTWFLTFSCNDLNWPDMLKALLIADGRSPDEADNLPFPERLDLVNRYPIVVSRQFTVRVNALMKFMKDNERCLGGAIIDFWYRIEFQNRGSPHLHMLVWCANVPDFSTPEGIEVIKKVVSCSLEPGDTQLRAIVQSVQIHKHTRTFFKDRNNGSCRFVSPRPVSETILCLEADETLANNGRFCVLQRNESEIMVNNYNPVLLNIWRGNIDIQPCGNITAVAYYVAKYASKCEPHDTGDVVKEAIMRAKRRGGSTWEQLFAVSMAILSQRLVSAAECAYMLCHLPLKMSSRKAVFVNSCKPAERFRMLRFEGDETSYYNNIFDRYIQRPDYLENLSLAEFAVRYETISSRSWSEDDGDIEMVADDKGPTQIIRLKDNSRMLFHPEQ